MAATTTPLAGGPATSTETEAERDARERALPDEAREDVRGGRVIADEGVGAWLDLFVRGGALPLPDAPSTPRTK